jgi:hypothetical protein
MDLSLSEIPVQSDGGEQDHNECNQATHAHQQTQAGSHHSQHNNGH